MKKSIQFILILISLFTVLTYTAEKAQAAAIGDYQTFQSGMWNNTQTWSRWNGIGWQHPAPHAPTSADGAIEILNGHNVTVGASVIVDQVTVDAAGIITINNAITLTVNPSGSPPDLFVYGTVVNLGGSLTVNSSAIFAGNSTYELNSGNLNSLPTATWYPSSTIRVTAVMAGAANAIFQSNTHYGNLVWNFTTQGGDCYIDGGNVGATHYFDGDVTIQSTGPGGLPKNLILTGGGAYTTTLAIGGSLNASGGILKWVNVGNISQGINISISKNLSCSSASNISSTSLTQGGTYTVNFYSTSGTYYCLYDWKYFNLIIPSSASYTLTTANATLHNTVVLRVDGKLNCGTYNISQGGGGGGRINLISGATLTTASSGGVAGSLTGGGSKVLAIGVNYVFNGSVAQSTGFWNIFPGDPNNITINNSSGVTTDMVISMSGNLYFTNGKLTTGLNTLTIKETGSIIGAGSGKYVIGKLGRVLGSSGSPSITFDIGDTSNYTPVNISINSLTAGGTLTAITYNNLQEVIASSKIDSMKCVKRHWLLTNTGAAFTDYSAIFNFVPGDIVGSADPNKFIVGKYNMGSWSYPTVGTKTSTSTQITGETSFSDFAIGEAKTYAITASAGTHGSIDLDGITNVIYGDSLQYTITPATGYHIDSVIVDGSFVGKVTKYTFTNVTTTHTISASFVIDTFQITSSAGGFGHIDPWGETNVTYGDSLRFTISPFPCYQVSDVQVDGHSIGAVTSYTFKNVDTNHAIDAYFNLIFYTINASTGDNGSIVPSGPISIQCGGSQTFDIYPNTHYHIAKIVVDGDSVGTMSSYNFLNVTSNHTIKSYFLINTCSVTSFSPVRNALDVAKDTNITVTFDKPMDQTTLNNSTIKINGSQSGLHTSTISYNSGTYTATIDPNSNFHDGELISITLTRAIKDASGDSLIKAYNWSFTIKAENSTIAKFLKSSTPTVGTNPRTVYVGDLDGDGDVDLAVSNGTSNTVSIMLNDGSGTFTQSSTPGVGNNPLTLTAGDFDGDGDIDLATANINSNTVSILLNNGSGTFTLSSTVGVGNSPRAITSTDLDGDGDIDLAVANQNSLTVSILKNNGSGTFTQSTVSVSGSQLLSIISGDYDGDGDNDLAVVNGSSVSILINNGTGTFTQSSAPGGGSNPFTVTGGDLDGDGDIDLAVTNSVANTVSILLNNGSGTFTLNSSTSVGNLPISITANDFDGDGDIDIATANMDSNTLSILINNGSGTFTQSSTPAVGTNPFSVVAADLDGDGDLDLAASNYNSNTVSILNNIYPPSIVSNTPTRNALNVNKNTNITVTFDLNMSESTFSNSTIKINGSLSGLHQSTLSYSSSTKTVTINPNTDFQVGELVNITLTRAIENIDGDSLAHSYYWSFTIDIEKTSSGAFTQSTTPGVGNNPLTLTAGDFDGDGDIDLATANLNANTVSILNNNGSGTYTLSSTVSVGNTPRAITSADLDGDGDIDLAVANMSSLTVSILKNDGTGTFTQSTVSVSGSQLLSITSGDYDGDGDIDLAVVNGGSISILMNNGTGTFTLSSTPGGGGGSSPLSVIGGDFDGDGDIDLALTDSYYNNVSIFLNNGSGMFSLGSSTNVGNKPISITANDLDGDGDIDLATANMDSNTLSILINNGSGTFTLSSSPGVGTNPFSVVAGDLDGDGDIDLAAANYNSNTVSILLNNGSGTFTQSSTPSAGSEPRSVVIGDFDGDGAVDLAVSNGGSNTVSIMINGVGSTDIIISAGWNLISLPRVQTNDSAEVVFPGKYGAMFGYDQVLGDYAEAPTLEIGLGYWIYYVDVDTVTINGNVADTVKISCKAGWHMIGSREREVRVVDLQLSAGTIYGSTFYYDTGLGDYAETAVIAPGQGIWVYVTQDCELTIP